MECIGEIEKREKLKKILNWNKKGRMGIYTRFKYDLDIKIIFNE